MPKLLSVNPTGYFSYGLHHTVQLDNRGLCLLNGVNKDRGDTANGCHAKGQLILMYDGTIKRVEDIVVGDQLMGPDSTPRNVFQLCRGRGKMVKIIPKKGAPFIVNEDHILTLTTTRRGYGDTSGGTLIDITVKEYLNKNKWFKTLHPLIRASATKWPHRELPLDPYFVGVLLGDGHLGQSISVCVADTDIEIVDEINKQALIHNLHVRKHVNYNKKLRRKAFATEYNLSGQLYKPWSNKLKRILRDIGLNGVVCENKFVPFIYKTGNVQQRLEVLAGLIDTDGSLSHHGFDFISKSKQLSDDVAYLARSVGLAAYVRECNKSAVGTNFIGTYHRVSISGDTFIIPTRLPRKRATKGTQRKNRLRVGFKIEPVADDTYFGFMLDGDQRYLLNDFTITHNSGKSSIFNTITQILFGRNPSGESGESVINEFFGKVFGRIIFISDDNIKWRITETKKWHKTDKYPEQKLADLAKEDYIEEPSEIHNQGARYSGTDVYLERWDGKIWVDERSTNTEAGVFRLDLKATRKKIISILRIDYDQFMNIGYMAQQQTLKFINGTHKERLEILADLTRLSAWDERILLIRADIAEAEAAKSNIESKLNGLLHAGVSISAPDPNQISVLDTLVADYLKQICDIDIQIKQLDAEHINWTSEAASFDTGIQQNIVALRAYTNSRISIKDSLDVLANDYAQKCNTIRERPRNQEIGILETEISELRGRAQARRFDLEQLLVGSGKCPRCRSNVTSDHLIRQRELLQLDIKEIENSIKINTEVLSIKIDEWHIGLKRDLDLVSEEYLLGKQVSEAQLSYVDTSINNINMAIEDLRAKKAGHGDDPQHRIDAIAQKRLFLLSEKARCDERARNWHEQKKKHDEYQGIIKEAEARLLQYNDDIIYLSAIGKLFGDKGFKAWKLNNLLAELNYILKEYVDIITDRSVYLWVTQYRQKSDGDMTADIQIMVNEGSKKDVPFNLYSGGERQQIMLAFIGAFWHLALQHGSGINCIFLDEILGPLDDINAQRVFNFLEHMRHKGSSTMLVVTHNQAIKDQMAFDEIWTATKKNHISTLTYE